MLTGIRCRDTERESDEEQLGKGASRKGGWGHDANFFVIIS